jgi:hypothetical protein
MRRRVGRIFMVSSAVTMRHPNHILCIECFVFRQGHNLTEGRYSSELPLFLTLALIRYLQL